MRYLFKKNSANLIRKKKIMNTPAKIEFNRSQLHVIRTMCAKDCNGTEFDLFIEVAKSRGLNPLLKHIYAQVYNKDSKDPKKPRQLVIIVSVEGQRVIANRTDRYRPDNRVPRFEVDSDLRDPNTNASGLVSAEVSVYVYSHGEWHEVPAIAYFEEYVPIVEEWAENPATGKREPTGKKIIDKSKSSWKRMPRIMLAKVAEMAALRKAFPEDYAGLYGEEEMDKAHVLDLSASQMLEEAAREQRMELVGGPGVMIDWMSGGPLDKVSLGQLHDRAVEFVRGAAGSPGTIKAWEDRNRHALRDLWAYSSGDGMDLKEEIEKAKAKVVEVEPVAKEAEPKPRRLKIKEKARLDEAVASLPSLRLSAHKAKKP